MSVRRSFELAFLLSTLNILTAQPQPDKLAEKFLGAWRLVSVEGHPAGSPDFYDDHPSGIIMYDRSGWMSVQIANHGNRPAWPRNGSQFHALRGARTAEEKAAAFDTYIAYYGRYSIDPSAGTVTHHLQDSSLPGSRGIDNIRYFEFQGENRLLLSVAENGHGGLLTRKNTTYKLLWERIK
ncbi:MAG TPA: lipocalin-like domain-containing protein [Bryobacteraceae bacterium]|nr:lipocalin-like domain-containing protein [Bryobacteraceae bacterium]